MEKTERVYVRADIIGELPSGQKRIRLLADGADSISFYSDAKSLIPASSVMVGRWIPVTERLPEEHESIFVSYHGTEKWQDGMFLKVSDAVLASVEYEDGKRRVKTLVTKDGNWNISGLYRASKVTHWMPLPEPPQEVS